MARVLSMKKKSDSFFFLFLFLVPSTNYGIARGKEKKRKEKKVTPDAIFRGTEHGKIQHCIFVFYFLSKQIIFSYILYSNWVKEINYGLLNVLLHLFFTPVEGIFASKE